VIYLASKNGVTLNTGFKVRSRSLEVAQLYRLHTSFYSLSLVTMALSCIVCEIQRLIGRKSQNFYTHLYLALSEWVTPSEFREDV